MTGDGLYMHHPLKHGDLGMVMIQWMVYSWVDFFGLTTWNPRNPMSPLPWRSKKIGRLLTASPSISATRAQWDEIRISFDVSSIQISMFNEELLPAAHDVHDVHDIHDIHDPFVLHSCSIHVPFISHNFASNSGKIWVSTHCAELSCLLMSSWIWKLLSTTTCWIKQVSQNVW